MKIKSGQLIIGKREAQEIKLLLLHSKMDIGYGSGGSFGNGEKVNEKAVESVNAAIENIEWILEMAEKLN
jgi:hypothetical protein